MDNERVPRYVIVSKTSTYGRRFTVRDMDAYGGITERRIAQRCGRAVAKKVRAGLMPESFRLLHRDGSPKSEDVEIPKTVTATVVVGSGKKPKKRRRKNA